MDEWCFGDTVAKFGVIAMISVDSAFITWFVFILLQGPGPKRTLAETTFWNRQALHELLSRT